MTSLDMYARMLTIRLVEDRLQAMCLRGEAGDLHFSKGQEAIAVGVCSALRPTDFIVTAHRTIAHSIAKGAELYPLLAEILGKATGCNGGYAGEMHLSNPEIRHAFSFQLVGTCVPVSTGLAWAMRHHHKTDDIVACFFGDATSSNGSVHEALTIAAIQKVPLLLICENNGLAGNITKEHYLPTPTVARRMEAYGIGAITIDGNDVHAVRAEAERSAAIVREHGTPYLIECNTFRAGAHKQGQGDARPKEWIAAELSRVDPILKCGVSMHDAAVMTEEINAQLDEVFAKVADDPLPKMRAEDD